jgi:inhibitor of cysteine peptidase
VINKDMDIIGELEKFSQGKQIQSSTFIGDKAYIETFNQADPFYVIDLVHEREPKIVGELEVPGYNTYMQPYGENKILAFGLMFNKDKETTGIKISLYDVSNPENPEVLSMEEIKYSDYNSAYTDVLYNNMSLMVDKEHNMIGFPLLYWISVDHTSFYKQLYFVFDTTNDELTLKGTVSHYKADTVNSEDDDIKRGMILNDQLYTVSNNQVKVNELKNLKLIKENLIR